jgi:hypothetical protein
MFPDPWINAGFGVKSGSLLAQSFAHWELLLYVGLYGKLVIKHALKAKLYMTLLRLYVMLAPL